MLNFDSTHKSVDGNIKEKKGKQIFKKIILTGLIIANLMSFSACAKTMPCDIEGDHAHYYVTQEEMGRYIVSEKSEVDGMSRLDQYISINQEEEALLKYMNKHNLYRIDENKEAIQNIENTKEDFQEYRYRYVYMQPVPIVHHSGKSTFITYNYIPVPKYSWTTDTTKNLTGEERTCHYVYYGYKITQDAHGKYQMERSDYVDSISDLPSEYEYVSKDFYKTVNLENKQELDYEDGIEDDIENQEVNEMIDDLDEGVIEQENIQK